MTFRCAGREPKPCGRVLGWGKSFLVLLDEPVRNTAYVEMETASCDVLLLNIVRVAAPGDASMSRRKSGQSGAIIPATQALSANLRHGIRPLHIRPKIPGSYVRN